MDGDSSRQQKSTKSSNVEFNDSSILQSVWIRHSTVLADITDRKFVESQFRYVLYSGTILWAIHILSTLI